MHSSSPGYREVSTIRVPKIAKVCHIAVADLWGRGASDNFAASTVQDAGSRYVRGSFY